MYDGGTFDEIYEKYASDPATKRELEKEGKRLDTAIALMELREKEGLSQRELARKVGKPQSTIARIENGSMNVTFDTLMDIVSALGKKMTISIK